MPSLDPHLRELIDRWRNMDDDSTEREPQGRRILDELLLVAEDIEQDLTIPEVFQRECPEFVPELKKRLRMLADVDVAIGLQTGEFDDDDAGHSVPEIPGYEFLEKLGQGGMGVVYKARQKSVNRIVALKMIRRGEFADADDVKRFLAEAEAIAELQHPNIVRPYEFGQANELPYFTFEFISGGSLADKLGKTNLSPTNAAQLVAQMAEGMAYTHQFGIVHRDLKPANILLTEDGTPKITDFGLAKRYEKTSGMTASGVIVGTPNYMSPEQAAGKGKHVGPAVVNDPWHFISRCSCSFPNLTNTASTQLFSIEGW